jgi:hypothetical protein
METNQRIIRVIGDTLSDSMSQVEQFVNWDLALIAEVGGDDYFKACEAIVEPRFTDDEASNEFSFCLESNMDLWEQYVRNSADGLVHKDKWIELIKVFKNYGY